MTTEERTRRPPRLATSQADELVYAIALAMARRQMQRSWGCRLSPSGRCRNTPAAFSETQRHESFANGSAPKGDLVAVL